MEYELTRYGEEYLETGSARLDKHWETLPKETSQQGLTRIKRSKSFDRLSKRLFMLESIKGGRHPIDEAFDYLKEGYRKTRGQNALKKELASMLKANLVREVDSGSTAFLGDTPGWEQKIQYDLGHRHPNQITCSQEEYEKPYPLLGEPEGTKLVKYGTTEIVVRPGETIGDAIKRLGKL